MLSYLMTFVALLSFLFTWRDKLSDKKILVLEATALPTEPQPLPKEKSARLSFIRNMPTEVMIRHYISKESRRSSA